MVPRSCKLCSSLGVDTKFASLDDQNKHAQIHASQLAKIHSEDDGDRMALEQVFANCFPLENFEEPMGPAIIIKEIEKSRSTLINICQRIIKANKNETRSMKCRVCKSNVRYYSTNGQETNLLLAHSCSHSMKKPFACRDCQYESALKKNVKRHVKKNHKIDSPVNGVHFEEIWAACFDEVKETLTKCFGVVNLDPDSSQRPLAVHRRSIFSDVFQNTNARDAGKIRCGQCQREICAPGIRQLEQHVCFHMRRGIYKCTKCGRSSPYKHSIKRHLAKQHGVPSPVHPFNYIDRSDEHHEEILDCFKKCFGKEDSSK